MTPSDSTTPESNNDNSQLHEFNFRPLTQGLGFHHEKQNLPKPKIQQTSNLQKSRINPPASVQTKLEPAKEMHDAPALHKIYGSTLAAASSNTGRAGTLNPANAKPNLSDVALLPQFLAWMIDLLIIGLGTMFIILCSSFITFGNFTGPFYSSVSKDFYFLFTTLFCLFYLFYFTLLDLNSSIGKSLMSIKVISTDKDQIEMKDTFIRALITLISLMGFGIPAALDFQGKLSKTALKK
ncbi:MAG: RDD family protein [Bdellovibrio sp.]|nr:RDD family protein [Bdellovibrio sp.]